MVNQTRVRMIEATSRLLQHRGYHGTSLSQILEESGAPRGSLYFHFPGGKDELVLEATRAAVARATLAATESFAAAPQDPAMGVRLFIKAIGELMEESDYTFGCPVAPVILDATGGLEALASLCRDALEEWVALLREAFVDAGIPHAKVHALALLVMSSIEGLLLIARAYRDLGPLVAVAAELEDVVRAAMPPARHHRTRTTTGA